MSERCCGNCRYAMRLEHQGQTLLVCPCRPERPGRFSAVEPQGTCRQWRERTQPQQEPDEGTRLIPLVNFDGLCAMVDAADYEWLSQHTWRAVCGGRGTFYACTFCKGKRCLMHRMIMNPPKGMVVDHKNRCGLDNHRVNLRNATHQQNCINQGRQPGASGFRGVSRCGDKWLARIWHRGRHLEVGLFDDPAEAARAWDRKAIELRGEFAYLNFPQEAAGRRIACLKGAARIRSGAAAALHIARHCASPEPSPRPLALRLPPGTIACPRLTAGGGSVAEGTRRYRAEGDYDCDESISSRKKQRKSKGRAGVCCACFAFFGSTS